MASSGVCEFKSEGEDCERCGKNIPIGDDIYFISDYCSDDGTYVCKACWDYKGE